MKTKLFAALGLLLLIIPAAQAQFKFITNADNSLTITGYNGPPWAVTIPGAQNGHTVTGIADKAFYDNSITSVTIPASVISIGIAPFDDCIFLNAITVSPGNPAYVSVDGVLFDISRTTLIQYPLHNSEKSYVVPSGVVAIGDDAFAVSDYLTSVTIPDSVSTIGNGAFYFCPLTSVTLPNSVTSIGAYAFEECTRMTTITIGVGLTNIGQFAFSACANLTGLYFMGNAPTSYGGGVFEGCAKATVFYLSTANGWNPPLLGFPPEVMLNPQTGFLRVTINPSAAVMAGATWEVDSGANENSGVTVTNLSVGSHTVSFTSIPGWGTPSNQTVTIKNGETTQATGVYTALPPNSAGLIVQTNGNGSVMPNDNGKLLQIGKSYTLTAVPAKNWLFSNWVASGSESFVSNNAKLTFAMESNLVFTVNFVANAFLAAQGGYYGLFSVTNVPREQTNSGGFNFNLTSSGAFTGTLLIGPDKPLTLDGAFDVAGEAEVLLKPTTKTSLTVDLQLDFTNQTVSGTVSDGSFVAQLDGYRNVFGSANAAKAYEGQYTLVVLGTNDPTVGPYGVSYGTVSVSSAGIVTFGGSLADGTTGLSQSSAISQGGYWPLYLQLYGGAGSLWAWNCLSNNEITGTASWINETNSSKTGVYRAGFTNQAAAIIGSWYSSTSKPLLGFTSGQVLLEQIGTSPFAITNQVVISSSDAITVTNAAEKTNKLSLTINKNTGAISGSFVNPSNPKQTIKVGGVILQGQTNAQGYFLNVNQSGSFKIQTQ